MGISTNTNFPAGFANGLTVRGMPILSAYPGKVFWCSSTGTTSNQKGTFDRPVTTLAAALSLCTAAKGDIVVIKPGHVETISSATALTLTLSGVAIIGLGAGDLRPTFTLDTATTTTIPVSAANISVQNCIFTANFADIVSVFTLTTAKNFSLERCYIKATATNMNFLNIVDTDATTGNADGLTLIGNRWIEPDLATLAMVKMDGTNSDVNITGNDVNVGVNNNVATLMAIATTKIVTNLRCMENTVYRLNTDTATGGLLITTDVSTNTGIIARNFAQHADTAAEILVTAASGFGFFENRASGVAGATGYVLPAADS
jgi:hypothetical protein